MQSPVEPVVPRVFHDEEDGNLQGHCLDLGEGNTEVHTEVGGDGVEEPDLRQFDGDVAKKHQGRALPLLLPSRNLLVLNLVSVEVGNTVEDHIGNTPAEIDDLVHHEAHYSRR